MTETANEDQDDGGKADYDATALGGQLVEIGRLVEELHMEMGAVPPENSRKWRVQLGHIADMLGALKTELASNAPVEMSMMRRARFTEGTVQSILNEQHGRGA